MKTTLGSYVVTQITGDGRLYIAEVCQENPLILKVEEEGPFSRLKNGDYIIDPKLSARIQDPNQEVAVLREAVGRGKALISGLRSLNVMDGKLHEILPAEPVVA